MSDDPAPRLLGRSWAEVEADIQSHREAAESAVVRWAWGPVYAGWERLEPLFSERVHGERPKTRELPEPEDRTTRDLFGWDDAGRVVVARRFRSWPQPGVQDETILVEGAAGPVQMHMHWPLGVVELIRMAAPEPGHVGLAAMRSWYLRDRTAFWCYEERFTYEGARLTRVDVRHPDGDPYFQVVEWDTDGEVKRIYRQAGDKRSVVYVRPPKGGVAPVRRRVEAELVDRIAAWVARRAPAEPVWALGILYDAEGNPPLPPSVGLATADDLDDDPLVRFNPAEWGLMDTDPDELLGDAFAEDCAVLNQHWSSAMDDAAPRRMFVKVAKALRDRDWAGFLTTADEFEVLAVDLELEDLQRNRRALRPK